ncbi:protein rep [Streptomyces sp. NPDC005774]|uniref:protein rep n=1 Tax=Streptomyces sp. NPDC005774 TaxID=3364728 RepID=UPI0036AD2CAF
MTPLARRDSRFDLLDGLQLLTTSKRLKSCRRMLKSGTGAATLMTGNAGGSFAGVCVCGAVHLCPICSAKIRAARAEQADTWVDAWTAAEHGVVFWTLTMRHYKRQPLGSLRKRERHGLVAQQHDAWKQAFGTNAGPAWKRTTRSHGVVGYYRVWECTCGANGWHPHFHVLLFTERPWSEDTRASFEAAAAARWSAALVKSGGYKPNEAGCRVDTVQGADQGAAGRYLFKEQDGRGGVQRIGQEMARGDMKKAGRGGRAPFEVAESAVAGVADDVALWHEFEAGTFGLRLMYLSNGMKAKLDALVETDDRTDEEIAADDGQDRTPVAMFPSETWHGHVARVRGRRLALIKAVEAGGQSAVRALIESWGLVWGRDVLDPPPSVEQEQR